MDAPAARAPRPALLFLAAILLLPLPAFAQADPTGVLGDIDRDGEVSIRDGVLLVTGIGDAADYSGELDCDRDGEVDAIDIDCILERILQLPPQFTLPLNENDPSLIQGMTAGGKFVEVQGLKAPDGTAAAATQVAVTGANGKLTTVMLAPDGMPAAMVAPNGTVSKFNWTSPTSVVATGTTGDGSTQAIVGIDLGAPLVLPLQAGPSGGRNLAPRGGQGVLGSVEPAPHGPPSGGPLPGVTLPGNVSLSVARCGALVDDAATSLTVTPDGEVPMLFAGTPAGSGQYWFQVPAEPANLGATTTEVCDAVAGLLGNLCDGLQVAGPGVEFQICPALAAAATAVGTPAAGAAILKGCFAGFGALRIACDTIGFSPAPGFPTLLEQACPSVGTAIGAVDRYFAGNYSMEAHAYIPGVGVLGDGPYIAPSTGPFPAFDISTGGDGIEIVSFDIAPQDPAPGEGYVATAFIACAPQDGVLVEVSILGTDGYSDFVQEFVFGSGFVNLFVPGAEGGVVDTVTVTVLEEGGPSRAVLVVF